MSDNKLEQILNAENQAEKIVADAVMMHDEKIKELDGIGKKMKTQTTMSLKKYSLEKKEEAEIEANKKYQNIIEVTKSGIEKERGAIKPKINEISEKLTKEIIDKWLL